MAQVVLDEKDVEPVDVVNDGGAVVDEAVTGTMAAAAVPAAAKVAVRAEAEIGSDEPGNEDDRVREDSFP